MALLFAMTCLILLLQAALLYVIPDISRPGIFFGVTVSADSSSTPQFRPESRQEFRRIRSRYRLAIAGATAASVFGASLLAWIRPGLASLAPMIQIVAGMAFWVRANREARAFAQAPDLPRTVSLAPRTPSLPGGWLFFLGPVLILCLAAGYLHSNWASIPEEFPVHWGLDGQPDRWATRSVSAVYGQLIISGVMNVLLMILAHSIIFRTRQISATGAAAERELAFKRWSFLFVMLMLYATSTVFAGLATRPVWAPRIAELDAPTWMLTALPIVVAIVMMIYAVRTGQGGTRAAPPGAASAGDGTPDECWKLGGNFYYNPADPAFLVEKRVGYGWTFNFANKWSWVFMAALVFAPLIGILLLR